jgi:hypothetical protein
MVPPLQARVGPSPLCRPEAQRRGAAQGRALSAGEGADAGDAAVTWNEKKPGKQRFYHEKMEVLKVLGGFKWVLQYYMF